MQKIVVDETKRDPRHKKYDDMFHRENHVNIFAGQTPDLELPVENPQGKRIGTARQVRRYGDFNPRAKGIYEYVIEWLKR
jgi:hypothetical protein